jgi:hypothetical protein
MYQEPTPRIKVERIIALKRYEQPPPGYFHLLPSRIITRIERGEEPSGFWERFWPSFTVRPSLAYALGLTVCGALTAGFFYPPTRTPVLASGEQESGSQWAVVAGNDDLSADSAPSHGLRASSSYRSTLPVPAPRASGTFVSFQEARAVPAAVYSQP